MYQFVGKKGRCYKINHEKLIIKLNYRCPKGKFVPDSFSCGKTPEEAKKNYESLHKKGTDKKSSNLEKAKAIKPETSNAIPTISNLKEFKSLSDKDKLNFLKDKLSKGSQSIHWSDGSHINDTQKKIRELNKKLGISSSLSVNKVNDIANKVRSGKKITKEEYNTLKPYVEKKSTIESRTSNDTNDTKSTLVESTSIDNSFIHSNEYNNFNRQTSKLLSALNNRLTIESYVRSSNFVNELLINGSIRAHPDKKKAMENDANKKIKKIDKLMQRISTAEDMVVYSGISKNLYNKIINSDGVFHSPAFISTSADEKVAEGFTEIRGIEDVNEPVGLFDNVLENPKNMPTHGYMLEIKLPKGSHAMALRDFVKSSKYTLTEDENPVGEGGKIMSGGSQHEILLNRNLKFRVISSDTVISTYKHKNGKGNRFPIRRIVVEVVN